MTDGENPFAVLETLGDAPSVVSQGSGVGGGVGGVDDAASDVSVDVGVLDELDDDLAAEEETGSGELVIGAREQSQSGSGKVGNRQRGDASAGNSEQAADEAFREDALHTRDPRPSEEASDDSDELETIADRIAAAESTRIRAQELAELHKEQQQAKQALAQGQRKHSYRKRRPRHVQERHERHVTPKPRLLGQLVTLTASNRSEGVGTGALQTLEHHTLKFEFSEFHDDPKTFFTGDYVSFERGPVVDGTPTAVRLERARLQGQVVSVNGRKRFGFIQCELFPEQIFFRFKEVRNRREHGDARVGQHVDFGVCKHEAISVVLSSKRSSLPEPPVESGSESSRLASPKKSSGKKHRSKNSSGGSSTSDTPKASKFSTAQKATRKELHDELRGLGMPELEARESEVLQRANSEKPSVNEVSTSVTGRAPWKNEWGYVYVKGGKVEEESRIAEFKAVTHSSIPDVRIALLADKNICAFLNSQLGGVVYFGVRDDGVIAGLHLPRDVRDLIRLKIDYCISKFSPIPPDDLYEIQFIPVVRETKGSRRRHKDESEEDSDDSGGGDGDPHANKRYRIMHNMFIVEARVSSGWHASPCFTNSEGNAWRRYDASVRLMSVEEIVRRTQRHQQQIDQQLLATQESHASLTEPAQISEEVVHSAVTTSVQSGDAHEFAQLVLAEMKQLMREEMGMEDGLERTLREQLSDRLRLAGVGEGADEVPPPEIEEPPRFDSPIPSPIKSVRKERGRELVLSQPIMGPSPMTSPRPRSAGFYTASSRVTAHYPPRLSLDEGEEEDEEEDGDDESVDEPNALRPLCDPVTLEVMTDPVTATDGYTYERRVIRDFFEGQRHRQRLAGRFDHFTYTSPVTGKPMPSDELIPNEGLKEMVQQRQLAPRPHVHSLSSGTGCKPMEVGEVASSLGSISSHSSPYFGPQGQVRVEQVQRWREHPEANDPPCYFYRSW